MIILMAAEAGNATLKRGCAKNISDFDKQKASSLSGVDNSRKGSVDSRIIELVNYINQSDDLFTTSSCSGRLAIISEVRF